MTLARIVPALRRAAPRAAVGGLQRAEHAGLRQPGVDVRRQRDRHRRSHHVDHRRSADDAARRRGSCSEGEICYANTTPSPLRRPAGLGLAVGCAGGPGFTRRARRSPSRAVTDPGVITTRQAITPAGVQSVFDGRVYGLTFGATDAELWVLTGRTRAGRPRRVSARLAARIACAVDGSSSGTRGAAGPGVRSGAQEPAGRAHRSAAAAAGNRPGGAVQLLRHDGTAFVPLAPDLGRHLAGAPALARTGASGRAVVPLVFDNALASPRCGDGPGHRAASRHGGVAPFGAVISQRRPRRRGSATGAAAGRRMATSRFPPAWHPTPIASSSTSGASRRPARSRASTSTRQKVTHTIDVGLHPTAMAWDEARHRLVRGERQLRFDLGHRHRGAQASSPPFRLEPFGLKLKGIAPTALAVSAGRRDAVRRAWRPQRRRRGRRRAAGRSAASFRPAGIRIIWR